MNISELVQLSDLIRSTIVSILIITFIVVLILNNWSLKNIFIKILASSKNNT